MTHGNRAPPKAAVSKYAAFRPRAAVAWLFSGLRIAPADKFSDGRAFRESLFKFGCPRIADKVVKFVPSSAARAVNVCRASQIGEVRRAG
jgi:hypothetical protein